MSTSRSQSLPTSQRGVLRLYFRIVQGTVLVVLALQLFLKFAYGADAIVSGPLLALYGAVIVLSWYGGAGGQTEMPGQRKPWGVLFGFIMLLVVLLCAETGGLASPYVMLLITTCVFAALVLKANHAITLTAIASATYCVSAWLYHGSTYGMLAGGLDELKKVLQQGPALKPDAVCTLVIHVGFFWLGTIIATRLAEGMKARVDHAESVALLDPLTALPNRRGFMQKLRLEAERVSQWDWSIGMLVIDLDHFKLVNDRFDHKVGDLALVHAARILREVAGPLDHVCRLGGEEFAVATVGADRQHAEDLAQRIVREFRKHDWHVVAPGLNALTCSIGVTVRNPNDTPDRLVDFGAMIQDADHALLIRKRHGRNGYFVAGDKVPLKERENAVLRRPDHDGPLEKPRFIRR